MIDESAPTFGLPACLRIPIAAESIKAIEQHVGRIVQTRKGRKRPVNAVCVEPYDHAENKHPGVLLWKETNCSEIEERLHPAKQVWVHVDYNGYRNAYLAFGMPIVPDGQVLDHIQNRVSIRLRGNPHPYIRLCPISRLVNTNAGSKHGGEGMEREAAMDLRNKPPDSQPTTQNKIIYADPMDITKMLDILPGTWTLPGVRDILKLLYPS